MSDVSITRYRASGNAWGTRTVRLDGSIRWRGRTYRPDDSQTPPKPGEIVTVADYRPYKTDVITEPDAPADPDNYIRRLFWREVEPLK